MEPKNCIIKLFKEFDAMKKLKLPIIRANKMPDKCLSMDDYLKFVEENLRLFKQPKQDKRTMIKTHTNVPFVFK